MRRKDLSPLSAENPLLSDEPFDFCEEQVRICMQSCRFLAVNQLAVGVKLENPSGGGNKFEGFDLIPVLAKDRPGNAESPFKVSSCRAVLEADSHHGAHLPGTIFALSLCHFTIQDLSRIIPATSRTGAGRNNESR